MLNNFRDLGGIKADGRRVKNGLFFRTAIFKGLTEEEKNYIRDTLGITRILDLRSDNELIRKKTDTIDGVCYINFPMVRKASVGISRDSSEKLSDRLALAASREERYAMVPKMEDIYRQALQDSFSRTNLRGIIFTLMDYKRGGTVFNCVSGKDRTGMVAAGLLTVLGADRKDIMEDYMKSYDYAFRNSAPYYEDALSEYGDDKLARLIQHIMMADESYLSAFFDEMDNQFGSSQGFIEKFLKITPEELTSFRNRALE